MRAIIGWVLSIAVCVAATVGVQWQIAKVPPPELDVNMLFVPPAGLTKGMAAGYENVIADGLWLGLLQYYGDRVVSDDKRAVNLDAMFGLITDLDPHFWFAYWLGAWALGDNNEGLAAVRLLQRGERENPADYNYPYLQGFIHFLFLKDYAAAARDFDRSAVLPDAPRFSKTMAARMYQKQGKDDLALQIWSNLLAKATDAHTRDIAKRNVDRIKAEQTGKVKRVYPVGKPKPGEPL